METQEIKEQIYESIYQLETDRAKGKLGDGLWHFARAYNKEGKLEIVTGCEASPNYPESEYHSKGEFPPVTFWTCREHYSPSPSEETLEWVDCTWEDDDAYYAHLPEDYTNYKCIDQEDIEGIKAAGYIPFKLGELIEPLDIDEQVKEALDEICEKWSLENGQ